MEQKGTVILNQRPENLFKRVSLPYEVDPAAELTAKYSNSVLYPEGSNHIRSL